MGWITEEDGRKRRDGWGFGNVVVVVAVIFFFFLCVTIRQTV